MKHKYLRELFPNSDLPFPYCENDYPDLDVRETVNLDWTLTSWLYEHLRCFKDCARTDLTWRKFDIDGQELNQIQCIDRMIEDCKIMLVTKASEVEKINAAKHDLFMVLEKVYWAMWW